MTLYYRAIDSGVNCCGVFVCEVTSEVTDEGRRSWAILTSKGVDWMHSGKRGRCTPYIMHGSSDAIKELVSLLEQNEIHYIVSPSYWDGNRWANIIKFGNGTVLPSEWQWEVGEPDKPVLVSRFHTHTRSHGSVRYGIHTGMGQESSTKYSGQLPLMFASRHGNERCGDTAQYLHDVATESEAYQCRWFISPTYVGVHGNTIATLVVFPPGVLLAPTNLAYDEECENIPYSYEPRDGK